MRNSSFYVFFILILFFNGCSSIKKLNSQEPFFLKQKTDYSHTDEKIRFNKTLIAQSIIDDFDNFLKKQIFPEYTNNIKRKKKKYSNSYLNSYKKISKFKGTTNE